MTNTYPDDAPMDVKMYEEMRCLRCVMERLLTSLDPAGFKDYQLEKFSGSAEARKAQRAKDVPVIFPITPFIPGIELKSSATTSFDPCKDCIAMKQIREQYPNGYTGDYPCQWCSYNRKKIIC